MILQKENLLVQLSVGDLQQLISDVVKNELQKITDAIKLNPKESDKENDFLTREETANLLKVSTTTLFLWNRDSILKAKKIGRRVYYSKSEVYNKLNLIAVA
ncbi:helix-turn-helix domain-containing protein [Flavobacterium facile]|uniref:helix-turn-helix domain-containing protein n=1 Tax=Flavobacterium facile TaxID=2893174 RepID=UPI002E78CFAC|nr:helix-turn-helix domain-containing protein [Flavobacterium sp. T-12]